MKTFQRYVKSLSVTVCILLAAVFWTVGCATNSNPIEGWKFCFSDNPIRSNKSVIEDYQDYIQKLPPKQRWYIGDISFFADGTGQHAVNIEIFVYHKNASWQYAIIYDKNNESIKVTKYGYRRCQS
jgi:hypothetical protein